MCPEHVDHMVLPLLLQQNFMTNTLHSDVSATLLFVIKPPACLRPVSHSILIHTADVHSPLLSDHGGQASLGQTWNKPSCNRHQSLLTGVLAQQTHDRRVYEDVRIHAPDEVKMLIRLLYEHLSNLLLGKGVSESINVSRIR